MNDDRYKELMVQVGMPNSKSLLIALRQVANEVAQNYENKDKLICGVAIRAKGVMIQLPMPARHVDCFEYIEKLGIDLKKSEIGRKAKDQGFYTENGIYLDRVEAFEFAKRNRLNLIDNPAGALCSENLW